MGHFAEHQKIQYTRDLASGNPMRPKGDMLKSFGLKLASIVGRLARFRSEILAFGQISERWVMSQEAYSIGLSAANLLAIKLDEVDFTTTDDRSFNVRFTDAVGKFADACEKIDHLEEFSDQAREAVVDIIRALSVETKFGRDPKPGYKANW